MILSLALSDIDASNSDQTRIAVTENDKLDDFEIESNKKTPYHGV